MAYASTTDRKENNTSDQLQDIKYKMVKQREIKKKKRNIIVDSGVN